jgi:hypothetical protein
MRKPGVTARQVALCLGGVWPGPAQAFAYTLRPQYPIQAKAPAAVAHEYYTPVSRADSRPAQLVVEDRK